MNNFFKELRRRNVIRVAGLYGVVGWLLAQAAGVLENALTMPAWFDTVVVSLLLIGLPIVLVFAWVFEITPEGLKRTAEVAPSESIAQTTGRKFDIALIAAAAALVLVFVGERLLGGRTSPAGSIRAAGVSDNSIAVLPFADMSPDRDQEYFADGVSEELLNVLAQVKGLQVAGRTSSFAFKNDNRDLREIGQLLNVSHILEGSVRKAGDRVRITAQLVKAQDGFHLWSATYDRQLTDIFAVQDEIAGAILEEMTPFLPAAAAAEIAPAQRADVAAYDLYLLAREKMVQEGTRAAYESAVALLDQAIAEDPDYAPALAWRSYAASMLSEADGGVGDTPIGEALPVIKAYADRAINADPDSPEALFAVGSYYGQLVFAEGTQHLDAAIEWLGKAVDARSNFSQAKNDLGYFLDRAGREAEALALFEDVLKHDPGVRDANVTYIYALADAGRFTEAEAALDRWRRLKPDLLMPKVLAVALAMRQGRLAEAVRLGEPLIGRDADPQIDAVLGWAHYALHDGAWLEARAGERWKAAAALLAGRTDLAAARASALAVARRNAANGLLLYIQPLYAAGRHDDVVSYYESAIGSPEAAMAAAAACNCRLAPLAAAMKEKRHPHYERLMSAWRTAADARRRQIPDGPQFLFGEGERRALLGDAAGAAADFQRAIDLGFRDSLFIHGAFRPFLPNDPRIVAQQARMRDLIDAERASLGMPPIAQIDASAAP
jgi:TolB-like protein/Flp pilus assembly protein TadD